MNRQRALILVVLITLVSVVWTSPIHAQCSVPAGWQPYLIVRGDNLFRLSLRFHTTLPSLQSGNCLTSTRIYAGQTLYVPAGGTIPGPDNNPIVWRSTAATFQQYERGFMIWRADSGDIWVYSSGSRNRLEIHPSTEYGSITSAPLNAPAGLISPTMGFAKMWTLLPDAWQTLGWATQSERSFTLQFGILNQQIIEFWLPNGSAITRYSDGSWSAYTVSSDGASVTIQMPSPGAEYAAGTTIYAVGQAGGIFEGSFVLELRAKLSDTVLSAQVVTYTAPDSSQPGSWRVDLNTGSYVGVAELRAIYTRPFDGGQVVLASAPITFR